MLHIFGKKYGAAGLFRGADDEGVPKGKVVEAVQVDGGENVGNIGRGHVELGQQFHFASSDGRLYAQLAGYGNEIFLQHLERDDAGAGAAMFGYKFESAALFGGRGLVVGVNEDVGVEEAAGGHRLFVELYFAGLYFAELYFVELCRE